MYTTNIIEGLNRQYRKVTKSVFPSDIALEKMLYLASENVVKKWDQRYKNWDQVLNQLITKCYHASTLLTTILGIFNIKAPC